MLQLHNQNCIDDGQLLFHSSKSALQVQECFSKYSNTFQVQLSVRFIARIRNPNEVISNKNNCLLL